MVNGLAFAVIRMRRERVGHRHTATIQRVFRRPPKLFSPVSFKQPPRFCRSHLLVDTATISSTKGANNIPSVDLSRLVSVQ